MRLTWHGTVTGLDMMWSDWDGLKAEQVCVRRWKGTRCCDQRFPGTGGTSGELDCREVEDGRGAELVGMEERMREDRRG